MLEGTAIMILGLIATGLGVEPFGFTVICVLMGLGIIQLERKGILKKED